MGLPVLLGVLGGPVLATAQNATPAQPARREPPSTLRAPSRLEVLRGEYGRYRANNDLLHYELDVRVDPDNKTVGGKNAIRFKMLKDDTRIQLELYANYTIDKILMGATSLKYERDHNTVYVDFPETLRAGRTYTIEFHYHGLPEEQGRFGGLAFRIDPAGRHWINTANEGEGSSVWWPSKDQWRDEPEGVDIRVAVPNGLMDVSNGKFMGKTDLGDGYTRWDWRVHYPINSYNVSLNIGEYVQFSEKGSDPPMDYFVLPENLEKAKQQFAQAKPMMDAYEKYVGKYPFPKDGFKLIEVPYSGMEHQSAVTYGNRYANGYLERVYVETLFGYDDALKYVNGYKKKVGNKEPIITQRGIHRTPNQDMYFKGALFLHTLRNVVNDDQKWWNLVRATFEHFKYRNIMTEDMVRFFSAELKQDLTPIFDQYLRRVTLPTLELAFDEKAATVSYRWNADERGFAMPIKVGTKGSWQVIQPTADWKSMPNKLGKSLEVATELFYVNVAILDSDGRPIK